MTSDETQHQALRELLGSYALGHLDFRDSAVVVAHLDGCAECRAELAEIAPLVQRLSTLSAEDYASPPSPPAGLGAAIREAVARERTARARDEVSARRAEVRRRRASRLRLGLAAASVVVLVGAGGTVLGRATAPEPPTVPTEAIALEATGAEPISIDEAVLVNHTWGTELRVSATGFVSGETYRAAFREVTGEWVPAGEFVGVGAAPMDCNLQSASLRAEVTEVVITAGDGEVVVRADL